MFYYNNQGKPIQLFNNRPRNMSAGGFIAYEPKNRYHDDDSINSHLEVGSLVIPKKVMDSGIMNGYKGRLTGPKTMDAHRLSPTIVMEGELVVHKKYAAAVTRYLKKHGITLPLDE